MFMGGKPPGESYNDPMRLDYLAHSCFLLEHKGYRVLFDPYCPGIGYPAPKVFQVDLIVVSHDHEDHNAVGEIPGSSLVARGVARRGFGPLTLDGEVGWHSDGEHSDPVSLTLLEWDGRRIAHFGDLGCALTAEQEERFKGLDLLMIPCGGGYTIDGPTAAGVVKKLKPRLVVPMHYRTPFLNRGKFPDFQTAEPFLQSCSKFAQSVTLREGWADLDQHRPEEGSTKILNLQHQMA